MRPSNPSEKLRGSLIVVTLAAALLTPLMAEAVTVAGVTFDPANATTSASITGGGYVTAHGIGLPSYTSADWATGNSLGTHFQRPSFQPGYSASTPVYGAPGTAATLGQDPNFPLTYNVREMIQLSWGTGFGLADDTGDDLAIFEQATSEAFAIRVHVASTGWSAWYYTPYESAYDAQYDATPTLIDFVDDLGLTAGTVINALEITNLIATDSVATQIGETGYGRGQVSFQAGSSGYTPGRWSSSQRAWVGFEPGKFDPDIQYVVGLHAISSGVSGSISALSTGLGSFPERLAPADDTSLPVSGALPMVLLGLGLMLGFRRLPSNPRPRPAEDSCLPAMATT